MKSSIRLIIVFWTICFTCQSHSQEEYIQYTDHVYVNFIKSVKIHHRGLVTSIPVVDLQSPGTLELTFDDLEGGDKEYVYEIIHCNKDWKPSDLQPTEYLDGFLGEDIRKWEYSIGTIYNYTHYTLLLPNQDLTWNKSGNYILAVYENEGEKILVFTRRFMVVENRVKIISELRSPYSVGKLKTHHEIEFSIDFEKFRIVNPMNEIYVTLMQNSRPDNAIRDITPKSISGKEMRFNYIDHLNFPALKEFRFADIRSVKFLGEGVHSIDINPSGIDVLMKIDQKRTFSNYHYYNDLNGDYVIETRDDNNDMLKAEYVNVIFTLESLQEIPDTEIYVFGKFTDWEIHPDFQMYYDSQRQIYIGEILLKQGYYDYYYAAVKNEMISAEALEGSWYETENDYSIFVYYSEFGSRYDRLIGVRTFNSADY